MSFHLFYSEAGAAESGHLSRGRDQYLWPWESASNLSTSVDCAHTVVQPLGLGLLDTITLPEVPYMVSTLSAPLFLAPC